MIGRLLVTVPPTAVTARASSGAVPGAPRRMTADVASPAGPPSAADARPGAAGITATAARAARVARVAVRRPWLPGTSALRPRGLRLITAFNHGEWWKAYKSRMTVHPQASDGRGSRPDHTIGLPTAM